LGITAETVDHIALLARLELTDEERELMVRDLGDILGHVARLEELDTDNVDPTFHLAPGVPGAWRADEPHRPLTQAEVLAMAPASEQGHVRVPAVIEE